MPPSQIIDIVLAVPDSADEPAYVPALEAAGYVLWAREADRESYLAVKRELAQRTWRHVQRYADAKSAIVGADPRPCRRGAATPKCWPG